MSNLLIKSYLIKKKIKTVKQFTQFSHNNKTNLIIQIICQQILLWGQLG